MRNYFFFLLIFSLAACSFHPPLDPGLQYENQSGVEDFQTELEELMSYRSKVETFRGLSRTRIQKDEDVYTLRQTLVYGKNPPRLRQETLASGSAYALEIVIAQANRAVVIDIPRKTVTSLDSAEELFEDLLGTALTQQTLLSLLLAEVAELPACRETTPCFSRAYKKGESLVFVSESDELKVQFHPELHRVEAIQLGSSSSEGLVARYKNFRTEGNIEYPSTVSLSVLERNMVIEMNFSVSKINTALADTLFQLETPAGFTEQ